MFFCKLFFSIPWIDHFCILEKIPVELLPASVAKGHVFPFYAYGTSRTDGIGGVGECNHFCNRKRNPVRNCIRKQGHRMFGLGCKGRKIVFHYYAPSAVRKLTGSHQEMKCGGRLNRHRLVRGGRVSCGIIRQFLT